MTNLDKTALNKIVLASNNAGKAREITEILKAYDISVVPQSDFGVPEIPETGLTFVENALLKARNACHHTGLPALADDSGIEIDALQGRPGIYSARYAGEGASDETNLQKALTELKDIPEAQRGARFQCLMVLLEHENDPTPLICQGAWEGRILTEPQGENGFGYDPIFYVPEHQCSSAQLTPDQKNALSHRGKALKILAEKIKALTSK